MEAQEDLRIRFTPGGRSGERDRLVFGAVRSGKITVAQGCKEIARNNGLKKVTREQFMFEMEFLGYTEEGKEYV